MLIGIINPSNDLEYLSLQPTFTSLDDIKNSLASLLLQDSTAQLTDYNFYESSCCT
jgi:hypothetical protein